MSNIKEVKNYLAYVVEEYEYNRKNIHFKETEMGDIIRNELPKSIKNKMRLNENELNRLSFKGSIGQGQYAEVPWVAVFNKEITETATEGYYIVFLFSVETKKVYLSLNQGWTFFQEEFGKKKGEENSKKVAENIREYLVNDIEELNSIYSKDKYYTNTIDLKVKGALGKGYENSHILGFEYGIDDLKNKITDDNIIDNITILLKCLNLINQLIGEESIKTFNYYVLNEFRNIDENILDNIDMLMDEEQKQIDSEVYNLEPNTNYTKKKRYDEEEKDTKKSLKRDSKVVSQSLVNANFKCEIDNEHESFISGRTGKQYTEGHHLIPLSKQDEFDNNLDNFTNVVSLCPTCHKKIHYGVSMEKDKILRSLFDKKKKQLSLSGIDISYEKLKEYYNI